MAKLKVWESFSVIMTLALLLTIAGGIARADEPPEYHYPLWSYQTSVATVSISADGSFIAVGSGDNKVYLFNQNGDLLWEYQTDGGVRKVSVSADGSFVAAGSADDKVYLFSREGELLWNYETGDDVRDVSTSADGSFVAAGSADDKVYLFSREGELLWNYETGDDVRDVSTSADGSFVAAGSADDKVYLFSREGELLWNYKTGWKVQKVSISADGSFVAAGSWDEKVYLFNREGKLLWDYKTGGDVVGVSISADGSFVAAGSSDWRVYLFNQRGKLLWSYEAESKIEEISMSADGSFIVATCWSNKLYFFNQEGELLWRYKGNVQEVSLTTDGSYVAVEGDGKILLFASSPSVSAPVYSEESEYECWAVIVGVSDYQKYEDSPGCANDAEGLFELLSPIWGEEHIKLLIDKEATKAKIHTAIDWLASNADANDTALFYFSGEGDSNGYIAPYNAYYVDTWISSSTLSQWLSALNSERVVIILDTCYATTYNNKLSNSGRVILASSQASEEAYATSDHGIFTLYLLEAFNEFSIADVNRDYELSAEEIFHYAQPKTMKLASDSEYAQHPVLSDQYPGELSLLVKFIFSTDSDLPASSDILILDSKKYLSVPLELTWAPGTVHNLEILSPLDTGRGTRYVFTSWNDGDTLVSITISHGAIYEANYQEQHQLLIESVHGEPEGAGWYDTDSTVTISVASVEEPTTRHIFTGWSGDYSGDIATASVIMDSPKTVTANWRTEYLLTIESAYGQPKGTGWHESGSEVPISVTPIEGIIIRHIFTGWSGDYSSNKPTDLIVMDSPKAVAAKWRTDYTQLYILIGVVAVIAATIIVLRIRSRRKAI